MPINSFESRRGRLRNPVLGVGASIFTDRAVWDSSKAVEVVKVVIKNSTGYESMPKQRTIVKSKNTPLDAGLANKKSRMMF